MGTLDATRVTGTGSRPGPTTLEAAAGGVGTGAARTASTVADQLGIGRCSLAATCSGGAGTGVGVGITCRPACLSFFVLDPLDRNGAAAATTASPRDLSRRPRRSVPAGVGAAATATGRGGASDGSGVRPGANRASANRAGLDASSPKCTANARSAGDSVSSRRKNGASAVPPGTMLVAIFCAPDWSPVIAIMNARARHAARSLLRNKGSSRSIASSGLPEMPSDSANRRIVSSSGSP